MDVKQMKLNSLLEVTQAINSNLPEESLYRILYFIVISTMKVDGFALAVVKEGGLELPVQHHLELTNEDILPITRQETTTLDGIEYIISVTHKEKTLAYLLINASSLVEDNEEFSFIKTLANVIMVAIENKRFARQEIKQQAVKKEMEIASTVQNMLFPKTLPSEDKITLTSFYLPHNTVGGDYYDYIEIDDQLKYLCIADVSGKGMPAALLMSNFQACLRTMVHQTDDLKEIINELNHQLAKNSGGEYFITFFVAKVDFGKNEIEFVNAGHNPIYYLTSTGVEELHVGSTILGAFEPLPTLEVGSVILEKGSKLLMYTDGISETKNAQDEEWGEEGLKAYFSNARSMSSEEIIKGILEQVDAFRGECGYVDDLTLLVGSF